MACEKTVKLVNQKQKIYFYSQSKFQFLNNPHYTQIGILPIDFVSFGYGTTNCLTFRAWFYGIGVVVMISFRDFFSSFVRQQKKQKCFPGIVELE